MRNALNWLLVSGVNGALRIFRLPGLNSSRIYAMLGSPALQPLLRALGRAKAYDVYRKAVRRCPAYREFLSEQNAPRISDPKQFHLLPETTKSNYVRAYTIEDRCYDGRLPRRGVVIDESSGSSGTPNNWVRNASERESVKRLLQHGYTLTYPDDALFVLNCFALGPWATGMNVSMSLLDVSIMKSIGPDKQKLENTLRTFGTRYRYLIAGYPPFVKDFLDTTSLELSAYQLDLVVGGEALSEGLRDHFRNVFRTVHSSYGASDLEINIAAETEFTIALRRLCLKHPGLSRELFGRDDPPMVFQYNPLDYLIERSPDGELVITILRRTSAAPKVRYNILDVGGTILVEELQNTLAKHGLTMDELPVRRTAFPLLFVAGRSDLTVPFYGAKVFTTDIDAVLNGEPKLRKAFHSFQMRREQTANLEERLLIALERSSGGGATFGDDELRQTFFEGLQQVNQDFREVSKMFSPEHVIIEQHEFGTGPFAKRDIRVKNQYIAQE